jgi:hypothetical protein
VTFAVGDRVRLRKPASHRGVFTVKEAVGESCVIAPKGADHPRFLMAQCDLEPVPADERERE